MPALAAAQPQQAVGQDAALEEGVELALQAAPGQRPGSALMNRGNSAPVLASVWATKLAACCCTRRYSVVCSGRWRSWRSRWSWAGRAAQDPARAGCRRAFDMVGMRHSPGAHSVARIAGPAHPRVKHSDGRPIEGPPNQRMGAFVHRACALHRSQALAPTASPHRSTETGVPAWGAAAAGPRT